MNPKNYFLIAMLCLGFYTHAQIFPASITGLALRVDAGTGFANNGTAAATWTDQSGGASLTSGTGAAEPVYTSNALGSGFPGIYFNGDDYIGRPADSRFNGLNATLFVVRIANTVNNMIPTSTLTNIRTTLSIGENGSYVNEFGLISNWGIHCTSSGAWIHKEHQCYSQLKDSLPAIMAVRLNTGATASDIDYYVNGVLSTEAAATPGAPASPYTAVNRSVVLGARYQSAYIPQEFFDGYLLEVIAYNRMLTNAEMDSVDKYLKCKYSIKYTTCNKIVPCPPVESVNNVYGINDGSLLADCIPNPSMGETAIGYMVMQMQESAYISVYDITGKELKRCKITHKGNGSLRLNTDVFAAGMYTYSLVVDGQRISTKKMLVAK